MKQILYRFLLIGIDIIPAAVILIPVLLIAQHALFDSMSKGRKVLIILFGLYLSAAFTVVGIPSATQIRLDLTFNLIPIIDIINEPGAYIINTLLNILLFIPLGCLMPAIWDEYRSVKKMAVFGFGMSAVIEILQMFTFRLTDIDDLIFNTLGAIVGYYIYILFLKFMSEKGKSELIAASEKTGNKFEQVITFTAVFLIMFIIRPIVSDALWSIILNYI